MLGNEPNTPGTIWAYNNWDYNALTTIFEQVTGLSVYEAFKTGLADPLDMQDFNNNSIYISANPSLSMHKKVGFLNFLIHLIKSRRLGYSTEYQFYKKCNFVSGSEYEKLLQKIVAAIE
jgi:CubicO group peptidase (beta-lactamase class C family)